MKAKLNNDWNQFRTGTLTIMTDDGEDLASFCLLAISSKKAEFHNHTMQSHYICKTLVDVVNNSAVTTTAFDQEPKERILPIVGQVYQHYKHGIYIVLGFNRCSETGRPRVRYQPMTGGEEWSRPLHEWFEQVNTISGIVPRFKVLET